MNDYIPYKLWIFNWIGGGYNSVRASNRETALKIANNMLPSLKVDESTLHEGTLKELNQLHKSYSFD